MRKGSKWLVAGLIAAAFAIGYAACVVLGATVLRTQYSAHKIDDGKAIAICADDQIVVGIKENKIGPARGKCPR